MTVSLLTNVRAVLPDRVADDATVAVEDGRIVGVEEGRCYAGAVDGYGAFCLPGLIDTHSDAIESEIRPRHNVALDETFALRSLEGRLVSAGITTICHGISFEDLPNHGRTVELAQRLVEVVSARRADASAPLDHRILYRVPARSEVGLDRTLEHLAKGQDEGELPLMSFEDHTPGQGQFRDLARFKADLVRSGIPQGEDVDTYVERRIAENDLLLPLREKNLERLSRMALTGGARVLVHDCEDAAEMEVAIRWGAAVAEFPLSVGAARAARDAGMPVVMGAPNVLRGGSHSGNVGAEELISADLCTSLASDYLPSSLLAATFLLVERKVTTLARAVRLTTSGAAQVAGVASDRGQIRVGARADLVLVDMDGHWPRVNRVIRSGLSRAAVDLGAEPLAVSLAG